MFIIVLFAAHPPALIRQSSEVSSASDDEEEASREPLLGAADNSIYLRAGGSKKPTHNSAPTSDKSAKHKHDKQLPYGTIPIYMSNNNGSPVAKQAPVSPHDYNNIDYVNQARIHPV